MEKAAPKSKLFFFSAAIHFQIFGYAIFGSEQHLPNTFNKDDTRKYRFTSILRRHTERVI